MDTPGRGGTFHNHIRSKFLGRPYKPSADILQQIAKALRISAEQLYVRAGILEDRPPRSDLVPAILSDSGLTERQKHVLVEIYQSFRRENSTGGDGAETGSAADTEPAVLAAQPPAADAAAEKE